MKSKLLVAAALAGVFLTASAQAETLPFDQAVFLSCSDAQAMTPADRQANAELLAERIANFYGVAWPFPEEFSDDAGILVRAACTLAPDSNLFAVIQRVVKTTFVPAPAAQ